MTFGRRGLIGTVLFLSLSPPRVRQSQPQAFLKEAPHRHLTDSHLRVNPVTEFF